MVCRLHETDGERNVGRIHDMQVIDWDASEIRNSIKCQILDSGNLFIYGISTFK